MTAVLHFEEETLALIGRRIDAGYARVRGSQTEFAEGSLEIMRAMDEARKRLPANQSFSLWLKETGRDHWGKTGRAALINLARNPELAREVLMQTSSRSYELIWREVSRRLPNDRNTKGSPRKAAIGPKEGLALEVYDRLEAQGRQFTRQELAEEAGVSHGTAARAYNRRDQEQQARSKIAPLDPTAVPAKMRERMEAWQRAERKRLRVEVEAELRVQYDFSNEQWLKHLHEFLDEAKRIKEAYDGIMSKRDYQTIVKCLHPDTTADQMLKAEAFRLFTQHKNVLLKPEPVAITAPPLPSLGELLARRRKG